MAEDINNIQRGRLPAWLKRPIGRGEDYERVTGILRDLHLQTVCTEASCPNRGECFSRGTATFMIMGGVCTRHCRFCGVSHGSAESLDLDEPGRVAQAVQELRLKYVVITSVTRDDLEDGGARHFARTIQAVRDLNSDVIIEILTPDFKGDSRCLEIIHQARPDVFNHNIETCRRLAPDIRSGGDYQRSLAVLREMASRENPAFIKSGFMIGLGESEAEISDLLLDLYESGVQILTIGQYLRPAQTCVPVHQYYRPEEFVRLKQMALETGFEQVASGPFVRSSYHADEFLTKAHRHIRLRLRTTPRQEGTQAQSSGKSECMPDIEGEPSTGKEILRVIIDPPESGVENMAIDETILRGVNEGYSPATLRFYRWSEPTISLGYFQCYKDFEQQDSEIVHMPVVRRQTGGGAILHDDELTYSLVLPLNGIIGTVDITEMYCLVHDAYIIALKQFGVDIHYRGGPDTGNSQRGPFFCFARRHRLDLMVGDDKILGSAQRRIKNAVLQHGSLIFGCRYSSQPTGALRDIMTLPFAEDVFVQAVANILIRRLKMQIQYGTLTLDEQRVLPKYEGKYAGQSWNRQR
ncbi:MAG: lipoyl synthase [Sedimentisphaerales bacterium]|nr:lipoyl synthase [Sedimentisphaerales bacterium]